MIPGVHKPLLVQKLLASPIGFILGIFTSRFSFGNRFSSIFGQKPTPTELDEHWNIILYNSGKYVQAYLIQYMDERMRNKERWVNALRKSNAPLCLIDGPVDPVSGIHLAKAVADIWEVEPSYVKNINEIELKDTKRSVIILPSKYGHYPQLECPTLVLSYFYRFMKDNFGEQLKFSSKLQNE